MIKGLVSDNHKIFPTVFSLRRINRFEEGVLYQISSTGNLWYYDPIDSGTPDNGVSVVVNSAGQRLKKFASGASAFSGNLISLLPLDLIPGAITAVSFRKIRSDYTGACIRVRRVTDNVQQDIGFINGVLDTTSLLAFLGGVNGALHTMYDQSGNGNNFSNSTNPDQPIIVNSGVVQTLNGRPAALYNGTNQYLVLLSNPISGAVSRNMTAVFRSTRTSGTSTVGGADGVAATNAYFSLKAGIAPLAGNPLIDLYGSEVTDGIAATTDAKIANATYDGTTAKLFTDNTLTDTATVTLATAGAAIGIGYGRATDFMQGYISEFIIWNDGTKEAFLDKLNSNINLFYSIY
jgi:hypothetical protein